MIIREFQETRFDGVRLYRTYSDSNLYIRQTETGNVYTEAIDVENANYTYEETDDIIEQPTDTELHEDGGAECSGRERGCCGETQEAGEADAGEAGAGRHH